MNCKPINGDWKNGWVTYHSIIEIKIDKQEMSTARFNDIEEIVLDVNYVQ